MEDIILFKTLVGSRLWKMERPDSDYDYFIGYMIPTEEYLVGKRQENSQKIEKKEDVSMHEIGNIVFTLFSSCFSFPSIYFL